MQSPQVATTAALLRYTSGMITPFNTTGIGSLPHSDPRAACRVVLDHAEIPFWPQLPALGFRELMIPMYSGGFPFVAFEGGDAVAVDPPEDDAFAFYTALESGDGFPISLESSAGLYAFLDEIAKLPRFQTLKGHITGPLTYTLGISDRIKRPLYYDDEKRELALSLLKGKAIWQISLLKKYADEVIIFIDEPILSALGTSAYLGVSDEEAGRMLRETVDAVREAGGISGIHCCGKAHWPLVLASGVDILNFDSYDYGDYITLYPEEVRQFINGGGRIAWGVVPTTDEAATVSLEAIGEKLRSVLDALLAMGIPGETIAKQSLITPSCGTGSLSVENAERVFSLLKTLKAELSRFLPDAVRGALKQ